jgi:hypothetical protein
MYDCYCDTVTTVLCSCYIPVYYEQPRLYKGLVVVDGGFSDNMPVAPGCTPTVTVSPYRTEGVRVTCHTDSIQMLYNL